MNKGLSLLTSSLIISTTSLLFMPLPATAADRDNLRGARYCEIIVSQSIPNFAVYNTIGLNDCPAKVWNKISASDVKKATGSTFVHLNGPRYWVIDGFKHSNLVNPTPKTINGLAMREAGVLHLSMRDLLKPNKPYQLRDVQRHTTWVYQAGKPVYELIAPNGSVYVMQSYSVQKKPQTEASLAQLGSKLNLPAGWKFKTGTLSKQSTIQAIDNQAEVVQDDLLNTYQKAPHDLL